MFFLRSFSSRVDSTSSASSSTHHEPVKIAKPTATRSRKKGNHYRSLNTISHHHHSQQQVNANLNGSLNGSSVDQTSSSLITRHRPHPPVSANSLLASKTSSTSIGDLSISMHQQKISSATIRLSSFQSKIDLWNNEAFKKIPLSQSYDWGMLAITNNDLILLYNKDKSSLVIFDAQGHENEVDPIRRFFSLSSNFVWLFLENSMVRWRNQRFSHLSR